MSAADQARISMLQHQQIAVVEVGADCPRVPGAIDEEDRGAKRAAHFGLKQLAADVSGEDHVAECEICRLLLEDV